MENENFNEKTLHDEDETETSFSASTVPSRSHKNDLTAVQEKANGKCFVPSWGLVFWIMGFLGFTCSYALRVCLSVTIVAMVNHTALADDVEMANATNTSDTDQCPRDPALQHADGEFTWDRHQQAAALATFYYGYVVSEVCDNNKVKKLGDNSTTCCPTLAIERSRLIVVCNFNRF